MSGNGYNSNMYPQLYNPANAPPPSAMSYPQGYPLPGQVGFMPPPNMPGGIAPTPTMYPGQNFAPPTGYPPNPTAPNPYYPPGAAPAPMQNYQPSAVEWILTTSNDAGSLYDRAVVAGYEGHDHSPLWVIRAQYKGDLIPGKFAVKHHAAYVPWDGKEHQVHQFELCCARPERVRWVDNQKGKIPPNAVVGGHTSKGEQLYIGRVNHDRSLTPGKVHPSHNVMYISYGGMEIPHENYQILVST